MSRPFIVIGDRTDHGGVVIGSSQTTDTHGKRIARVGDQVTCPKKGHGGTTVIVSGDPTMIIDGQPAARHGDKCACGATLIAGQAVSRLGTGSGASSTSNEHPIASDKNAAMPSGLLASSAQHADHSEEIIETHFSLLDNEGNPVDGYRYDLIENGVQKVRSGDFSSGNTTALAGASDIDVVYWLNKSGVTKS